ncbi:ATP-binding cassette domain-containing protein [Actinocorallia aurantiaca]|uniref:ABC transporter ATP-binding protein n=1 Tax=Actinocorallia aurantiaca TaxID=46204 RepID=A0ABN3UGA1_9ACTN
MIEVRGLSKRYGGRTAVDRLDFTVRPGVVTGFLGPNGAGKSTTMRMILGLDRPTAGTALVGGRPYRDLHAPLRQVGALLDAKAVHGGRSARNHLRCLAAANAIPAGRVEEVLAVVGLTAVADRPCRGFSLGMGQRLGIAAALLGDPAVLIFDEPVNGLDPEGILWIRTLMRNLAAEGRTVFVSSHLMAEMALTAEHLLVIGRGRILADTGMREFIEANSEHYLRVRTPRPDVLCPLLARRGLRVEREHGGAFRVGGASAPAVGELAARAGVPLHELSPVRASLEEAFLRLTGESVEYRTDIPLEAA